MKRLRVYVDTSVIGGCVEAKFSSPSLRLMKYAADGAIVVLISPLTRAEMQDAPPSVRQVLVNLPAEAVEEVPVSPEAIDLANAYIEAKVIGPGMMSDAQHIATATVHHADVLVSWNFKHIVNLARVRGYNSINVREGYPILEIRTPREVNLDADDREGL